jgi:tRNA dimethylallyltransferase
VPFLVGGTGLYIEAVVKNLPLGDTVPPNKKLRQKFERDLRANRAAALKKYYQKLLKLDPRIKIDKNNPRRIIRALEICLSGKKFSEQAEAGETIFNTLQIGVTAPPEKLYQQIGKRVDKMIKAGLEKEARRLSKKYSWESPAMSGIGYREWRSDSNKSEIAEQIKKDTRNYAKRQMTWWRRDKKIHWVKNAGAAQKIIKSFLTK